MVTNAPIGVFDSGVGGLSVLGEIRQQLPHESLLYVADSGFVPYGERTPEFIRERCAQICQFLLAQGAKALVVACNTASTLALHHLRTALPIPVVGVVPAIKVAAGLTSSGHIGLLATPATVNRPYTDQLIDDFAGHCQVHRFGSANLVQWAEDFLQTGTITPALKNHLAPWIEENPAMQHVVLGCTHFPLLRAELEEYWPHISWIDSGSAIARRVESLLGGRGLEGFPGPLHCYWTGAEAGAAGAKRFLTALGNLAASRQLSTENPVQSMNSV